MSSPQSAWWSATTEHLLAARRKNGRLGHKKSRSGCLLCKSRRLKCDETQPCCHRCHKADRECVYPHSVPAIHYQQRQFASLEPDESRQWDFFISVAAPQLAGVLDLGFWRNFMLQAAQNERFVVDSVLAISTLYEHPQFLRSFYSRINEPDLNGADDALDPNHAKALRMYSRAIRSVQDDIGPSQNQLMSLLSCALFLCIELLRDNVFVALELHKRGVAMLIQFNHGDCLEQDQNLLKSMTQLFGRMGALIPSLGHPQVAKLINNVTSGDARDRYRNLSDARDPLFALIIATTAWAEELRASEGSNSLQNKTGSFATMYGVQFRTVDMFNVGSLIHDKDLPKSSEMDGVRNLLQDRQGAILKDLFVWRRRFESTPEVHDFASRETTSYLLMLYGSTLIWLSCLLETSETSFDHFRPQFEELLHHAEIYLSCKGNSLPTFTFEIGATPALFLVASKCRIPSIRRHALHLMSRAPRKECLHGSASTAEFTRRLIEIEEEGLGLPLPRTHVEHDEEPLNDSLIPPEEKRICRIELLKDIASHSYALRIGRHSQRDEMKELVWKIHPL